MSYCKACGGTIEWGYMNGRWVPLEPVAQHDDLPRTYIDENGELRADHRDRHGDNSAAVNIERLTKKIPAERLATPEAEETLRDKLRLRGKKART